MPTLFLKCMQQKNLSRQKILFCLLTSLVFICAYGQRKKNYTNATYLEIGGNGLMASVHYERQLFKSTKIYGHIGVGIYGAKQLRPTIPFGVNYLLPIDKSKSFIDFGAGVTYTKADVKLYIIVDRINNNPVQYSYFNFIPHIGFRHHSSKNFMYKLSITPVFNHYDGIPFIGFSFGKIF
ncbi:MAG: hypothetical protein IPM10_12980 [Chitinophagaceae bacterium]|nr:hypothetical protein [Chitinophagaceae bacterium]